MKNNRILLSLIIIIVAVLGIIITQELQVDGNLKVTGTIDAQGNPITNIGEPTGANDAVNMGFLQSEMTGLSGMKPDRIYRSVSANQSSPISLVVPTGKSWQISISSWYISVYINEIYLDFNNQGGTLFPIWAMPNDNVIIHNMPGYFTIFEYSITDSGTDQDLDYVEP